MKNKPDSWQERFGLTTCTALALDAAIPDNALGVAVIYERTTTGETIFLVIESRASALRDQCERRFGKAKLPARDVLTVSFKCEVLADARPETVRSVCREQVSLAGELRRELRPAMR